MPQQSTPSFLFHDYETWGISPQHDYPCQFAAIRTDLSLTPIDEPINIVAKIHPDYLPHPKACLVTGITPQSTLQIGLTEYAFMRQIQQQMSEANTCSIGYNSIKFDDEFTRFSLFRNFYDPYQREWQNGNSRWDIIDLVRACYALRPEGIVWPENDKGLPSFKLESLTQANGVTHEQAHDALSDVHATIAIAKLIQTAQPKLFSYAYQLRSKHAVLDLLEQHQGKSLLYINPFRSAKHGCVSYIVPICDHPTNSNATICVDLTKDITPLLTLNDSELQAIRYVKREDRNADTPEFAALEIKHNQCPFIAKTNTLSPARAQELELDLPLIEARLVQLNTALMSIDAPQLLARIRQVFVREFEDESVDVEASLYSGGFLSKAEKDFCTSIHYATPEELPTLIKRSPTPRLAELLLRFIGRNHPEQLTSGQLTSEQQTTWHNHCLQLAQPMANKLSFNQYFAEIEQCKTMYALNSPQQVVLDALFEYGRKHPFYAK